MISRRSSSRSPWSLWTAVWILGTLLLLVPSLARWISAPPATSLPWTPLDRVNPYYARHWVLVQSARDWIPAGASYTAISADRDSEMLLYMLSLDIFTDHVPIPSSYQRVGVPDGERAHYVISYDCVVPEGARLLHRFPEGCVWKRSKPRT